VQRLETFSRNGKTLSVPLATMPEKAGGATHYSECRPIGRICIQCAISINPKSSSAKLHYAQNNNMLTFFLTDPANQKHDISYDHSVF
jgi:hypothetical protein